MRGNFRKAAEALFPGVEWLDPLPAPESVCLVFTRNWIDPDGEAHGFRYVSATIDPDYAAFKASQLNDHPTARASKWEATAVSVEMILAIADGFKVVA